MTKDGWVSQGDVDQYGKSNVSCTHIYIHTYYIYIYVDVYNFTLNI